MSRKTRHAYAPDVLPEELLEAIRPFFQDGNLWIPTLEAQEVTTRKKILKLKKEGHTNKEIGFIMKMDQKTLNKWLKVKK